MKKKVEKLLANSLVVLGYVAPIGFGIWRVLRRKNGPHTSKTPVKAARSSEPAVQKKKSVEFTLPSSGDQQRIESLSLSTPGDAPLDRLARRAVWEQQANDQPEHPKLKAPVPPGSDNPRTPDDKSVESLLQHQSLARYRLEGWSLPEPQRLPVPTYAPAIMAFGIVVFAMGLATVWYVCVAGVLVFAVAAWRWTGELQGE